MERPVNVIVSHWEKQERIGDKICCIPLRLIKTEKFIDKTHGLQAFFEIESPKSPLPVIGEFHSNVKIITEFLRKEGFYRLANTETFHYLYIHE